MQGLSRHRGLTGLALLAVVALVMGAALGPVAGASSGGSAQAAKKKCKKKAKKGADAAKKKKCKKKKKKKKQAPLVRATITWANADSPTANLSLYVFDATGQVSAKGASAIPNSTMSPDVVGTNGSETFTDLAPVPLRTLSFGVCYVVGGSAHAPFTITYVTADGQSHTETRDPGSSTHYEFPGGAPIPVNYCNFA